MKEYLPANALKSCAYTVLPDASGHLLHFAHLAVDELLAELYVASVAGKSVARERYDRRYVPAVCGPFMYRVHTLTILTTVSALL